MFKGIENRWILLIWLRKLRSFPQNFPPFSWTSIPFPCVVSYPKIQFGCGRWGICPMLCTPSSWPPISATYIGNLSLFSLPVHAWLHIHSFRLDYRILHNIYAISIVHKSPWFLYRMDLNERDTSLIQGLRREKAWILSWSWTKMMGPKVERDGSPVAAFMEHVILPGLEGAGWHSTWFKEIVGRVRRKSHIEFLWDKWWTTLSNGLTFWDETSIL